MKKEDIKSIFLIFFILVLIVTISIFGINIYMDIMREQSGTGQAVFEGDTTILPDDKKENALVVEMR